jgi:hypothetical protein
LSSPAVASPVFLGIARHPASSHKYYRYITREPPGGPSVAGAPAHACPRHPRREARESPRSVFPCRDPKDAAEGPQRGPQRRVRGSWERPTTLRRVRIGLRARRPRAGTPSPSAPGRSPKIRGWSAAWASSRPGSRGPNERPPVRAPACGGRAGFSAGRTPAAGVSGQHHLAPVAPAGPTSWVRPRVPPRGSILTPDARPDGGWTWSTTRLDGGWT